MRKIIIIFVASVLFTLAANAQYCNMHRSRNNKVMFVGGLYQMNGPKTNFTLETGAGMGGRTPRMIGLSVNYANQGDIIKPMIFMQRRMFNDNIYAGVMVGGELVRNEIHYDFNTVIGAKITVFITPRVGVTYNIDYSMGRQAVTHSIGLVFLIK